VTAENKVKAVLEADRGDATGGVDSNDGGRSDGETSGGDHDAEETLQQGERPSKLAYKLRYAATYIYRAKVNRT
jgi:hypothetical protein